VFTSDDLHSAEKLAGLRRWRFGAQKESLYDMMLYAIAARGGISPSDLKVIDTPMNDGLLAVESKSLDLSAAGLTQVTEIQKQGGRLAISMENAGFADITGFIARKSMIESRRSDLENLIRTWFDCVDYVFTNVKSNSVHSLSYLKSNAATQYTFDEYSAALAQEYLPRSLGELRADVLQPNARYDMTRIGQEINAYLLAHSIIKSPTPIPVPLMTEK
jgi:hypothetical protein